MPIFTAFFLSLPTNSACAYVGTPCPPVWVRKRYVSLLVRSFSKALTTSLISFLSFCLMMKLYVSALEISGRLFFVKSRSSMIDFVTFTFFALMNFSNADLMFSCALAPKESRQMNETRRRILCFIMLLFFCVRYSILEESDARCYFEVSAIHSHIESLSLRFYTGQVLLDITLLQGRLSPDRPFA